VIGHLLQNFGKKISPLPQKFLFFILLKNFCNPRAFVEGRVQTSRDSDWPITISLVILVRLHVLLRGSWAKDVELNRSKVQKGNLKVRVARGFVLYLSS